MKKLLRTCRLVILTVISSHAWSQGDWNTAGNALSTNGILGSNSNFGIVFRSNGINRGTLTTGGRWHFNSIASPTAMVQITHNSGQADPQLLLYETANDYARMNFLNTNTFNYYAIAASPNATAAAAKMNLFYSGFGNILTLQGDGKLGIGTLNPQRKVHIFNGAAGAPPANSNSVVVIENNNHTFLSLISTVSTEKGIYFGDAQNSQDGGIIYNGVNNELRFLTNGSVNRMTVTSGGNLIVQGAGNIGLGIAPARKFHMVGGDIRMQENAGTSRYFEFFGMGPRIDWRFGHVGNFLDIYSSPDEFTSLTYLRAYFEHPAAANGFVFHVLGRSVGNEWVVSDGRLKKDVVDFKDASAVVRQLQPRTYHYRSAEFEALGLPEEKQYGFIAQELEKVLPELVTTAKLRTKPNGKGEYAEEEFKVVNYKELIPVLVRAMQEQEERLTKQEEEMKELREIVKQLQRVSPGARVEDGDNLLEQNYPNPANGTTRIGYSLPAGSRNAQLLIVDAGGRTVQTIALNGNGFVNVDTRSLEKGQYYYTLVVQGQTISSKKMSIVK